MKNCSEYRELFTLYIDNELDDNTREKFENHVKNCEACRTEMEEIMQVMNLCASMSEEELPETFKEKLHKKLVDVNKKEIEARRILSFKNKYIKIISSVAAVLLLAFILRESFINFMLPGKFTADNAKSEIKADAKNMELSEETQAMKRSADSEMKKVEDEDTQIIALDAKDEFGKGDGHNSSDVGTSAFTIASEIAPMPSELKDIEIVVKTGRQEELAEKIKAYAAKHNAESKEYKFDDGIGGAHAKSFQTAKDGDDLLNLYFKVPNAEYENFITALKSDPEISTSMDFGDMNVINVEDTLVHMSKRIEELNIEIGKIEQEKNPSDSAKLEQLKYERDAVLLDMEKLKIDTQYIVVAFKIQKQ